MTRIARLLPLALAACTGGVAPPVVPLDVRIDDAGDDASTDSEATRMCVTEQGHVYVVWMDDRDDPGGTRDLWLNRSLRFGDAGTWLPRPVRVNARDANKPGPGQVYSPQIACNDQGVFVVWEDDRDGLLANHQIYLNASYDDGETWHSEDVHVDSMDPEGGSMSLLPRIAASGKAVHVVWYDGFNGPYDIYHAMSDDAGLSFRSPQSLDTTRGDAFSSNPRLATSLDGQVVWVVWEEARDGRSDIYVNRSRTGGVTFTGPQRLDGGDERGATNSFAPELCTDGGTNVYVVWHDERSSGENRDIYFNRSADGGASWLAAARRLDDGDTAGFSNSLFPRCTAEGPKAHVVWQDYRTGRAFDIWYREIDGETPRAEERVDVGEDGFAQQAGFANSVDARVAVADGRVAVAWLDFREEESDGGDNGFGDIRYNHKDVGGTFQELDLRVDSGRPGGSFKTDVNLQLLGGDLYAAWTDGREGDYDVYFTRLAIGEEGEPIQPER